MSNRSNNLNRITIVALGDLRQVLRQYAARYATEEIIENAMELAQVLRHMMREQTGSLFPVEKLAQVLRGAMKQEVEPFPLSKELAPLIIDCWIELQVPRFERQGKPGDWWCLCRDDLDRAHILHSSEFFVPMKVPIEEAERYFDIVQHEEYGILFLPKERGAVAQLLEDRRLQEA